MVMPAIAHARPHTRPSTRSNRAPPVARVGYASSRRVAASVNITLRHLNASARPHAALERVQGAVDLKFLRRLQQARPGTSNRQAALEPKSASAPVLPKFMSEAAI